MIVFGVIYCITNKVNGKKYIGQTIDIQERLRSHFQRNKIMHKSQLKEAIKKYGKENFDFQIIAQAYDGQELNDLEEKYIKEYNTMSPNGYNIMPVGGFIPYAKNKEVREKISLSLKGKKHGRRPSENAINALKKWRENQSKEEILTRAKYASACAAKKPRTDRQIVVNKKNIIPNKKGCIFSEETKKRISIAKTGKPCSNIDSQKRVEVKFINKETGEEKVFQSVKSCAKYVGLDENTIWKRINNQIKFGRKNIRHLQFKAVKYLNWNKEEALPQQNGNVE